MTAVPPAVESRDCGLRRRVVLVTPGFSAAEEDWCIPILRDFAEALAEQDEVSVVALRYPQPAQTYSVAGIRVIAVGGGRRRRLSRLGLLGREVIAIAAEARRCSADVIHAFWAHEPGAVACLAGRLSRVPVVVTLMGGELTCLPEIGYGGLLAPGNRMLARLTLAQADRVIALSRKLYLAAEAGQVEPSRLCRLDLGVCTDRFRARSRELNQAGARFLMVGSLVPVKGHTVVLQAFARCRREQPQSSLDLVGEGPLRGALEQQVRELGLGSAVRFLGAVDHSELGQCFDGADVLVVGSWWEGTPQVAHEALASGLPIVGTAVGVLPELAEATRCVPVGDAEGLAREMIAVAANAELRARMAAAASAAVRPISTCITDHRQLYDSLRHRGRCERAE